MIQNERWAGKVGVLNGYANSTETWNSSLHRTALFSPMDNEFFFLLLFAPRCLWRVFFFFTVYDTKIMGQAGVRAGPSCSQLRPWHGKALASWETGWWTRGLLRRSGVAGDWGDSSQCSWWRACCKGPAQMGGCAGWGCHWGTVPPSSPVCLRQKGEGRTDVGLDSRDEGRTDSQRHGLGQRRQNIWRKVMKTKCQVFPWGAGTSYT